MSEATVINMFLLVRVFLVGGILLILPRILRKGLFFGVYIGEGEADSDAARQLLRSWRLGCVIVMLLALVVGLGISAAGWPVAGNLTGTAVLLLAAGVLYLRTYTRARKLVPPQASRQAQKAVATLEVRRPGNKGFAWATVWICLIAGLLIIIYAVVSYRAMPAQVPSLKESGVMVDKSLINFIYFPVSGLVVGSLFALLALFTAGAKRILREGSGSRSAEAQDAFQVFMTNMHCVLALLFCAALTLISVEVIRVGLLKTESIGAGIWLALGVLLFFMLSILVLILWEYGQGGALREHGSAETPLTGSLADNERWLLGLFYFDRDDPSMMVEKRFGFGYTLNYAKPGAIVFTVTYLALTIGLAVLGVYRLLS